MNPPSGTRNSLRRIPLTIKMVVATIAVGIVVWVVMDYIQSRRIKNIFMSQLTERLGQQAMEDRLRFDRYVKAYQQSVRIFVIQSNFSNYIDNQKWAPGDIIKVKNYSDTPPWFPIRTMLHILTQPRYVVLIDSQGKVREAYQRGEKPLPRFLLQPTSLLIDKTNEQSYLSAFDNTPYLIASASYLNSQGRRAATLMLAAPIDDEFLNNAIGISAQRDIVALITPGKNPFIITSSNLMEIPTGAPLVALQKKYLVTGKEFFDYGSSELVIKFVSLMSLAKADELIKSLILRERGERAVSAFVLVMVFAIIMFWITQRIQRLTGRVSHFSRHTLGVQQQGIQRGDQLHVLEECFQHLTEEVARSREIIKQQAETTIFKWAQIFEHAGWGIVIGSTDGKTLDMMNPAYATMHGYSVEELTGRPIIDVYAPECKADLPNHVRIAREKGHHAFESKHIHKDGTIFPVLVNVTCVKDKKEKPLYYVVNVQDITNIKRMEKEILEIEGLERKRIGYDLHDDLGQQLAGISYKCGCLETNLKEKLLPEAEAAERIKFLIDRAKVCVKNLARGLSPMGESREGGLPAAIEELVSYTRETFNVRCVFKYKGPVLINDHTAALHLYRIAQEAIINAVKHAAPENIEISLEKATGKVVMSIKDDGTGFAGRPDESTGMGLKIMKYRANMIGASLDILPDNNGGTIIVCIFFDKRENITPVQDKYYGRRNTSQTQ